MDRSPLHSFITSRSCVPAGHKSGGMKLEQPRPLQVGPKRKNEPEEVSWRGDGRWNFGDDSVQLGLEWMRGIPTKQISGWDIFRMDIFIVCLSLSIGMSNLHKFTWSTSDSLHPDVFAMGGWRLWQDSEAEEGEQADPDSEEWEISLLWASSFQSTVGLVIRIFAFGRLSKKSMNFQEIETSPASAAAIIAAGFQLCQEAKLPARHRVPRPFSVVEGGRLLGTRMRVSQHCTFEMIWS